MTHSLEKNGNTISRPRIPSKIFILLSFLSIFFLVINASSRSNQVNDESPQSRTWIRTGGPSGGLGYDIRIHPGNKNIMFITDNPSGVNKSYDGGMTWVPRNDGITSRTGPSGDGIPIFSLTIDPSNPDIVWSGTQGMKGIYKSTDGGETWIRKDDGITEENEISFRGFAVHPFDSNIVFAGAEISTGIMRIEFDKTKGKIDKTGNGGDSWECVWEGGNLARIILFDPTNSQIVYAADHQSGVYMSTDGGVNWESLNEGLSTRAVTAMAISKDGKVLYVATEGEGVFRLGEVRRQPKIPDPRWIIKPFKKPIK